MKKQITTTFLIALLSQTGFTQLNSQFLAKTWKLKSYDAIEKIKFSTAYTNGSAEMKKVFDKMAKLVLDSTRYDFKANGTLVYTDIELTNLEVKVLRRNARWSIKGDTLTIEETERDYQRKAKIIKLTANQLVIIPIINGQDGSSQMVFE